MFVHKYTIRTNAATRLRTLDTRILDLGYWIWIPWLILLTVNTANIEIKQWFWLCCILLNSIQIMFMNNGNRNQPHCSLLLKIINQSKPKAENIFSNYSVRNNNMFYIFQFKICAGSSDIFFFFIPTLPQLGYTLFRNAEKHSIEIGPIIHWMITMTTFSSQ